MEGGKFECLSLCRSSTDLKKEDEVRAIRSAFAVLGAKVSSDGDYLYWTPILKSDIVDLMSGL